VKLIFSEMIIVQKLSEFTASVLLIIPMSVDPGYRSFFFPAFFLHYDQSR
jgi:hypothetical protein